MIDFREICEALGDGETPHSAIIKDELYELKQTLSLDGFHLGKGRIELRNEQSTIRQGVDLGLLRILIEIVRIEIGGNPPRRYTSNDYCLSIIEIELLVKVPKLLHDVIVAPEIELLILVGDGSGTRAGVLTTVTVHHIDLGPIIENGVV